MVKAAAEGGPEDDPVVAYGLAVARAFVGAGRCVVDGRGFVDAYDLGEVGDYSVVVPQVDTVVLGQADSDNEAPF